MRHPHRRCSCRAGPCSEQEHSCPARRESRHCRRRNRKHLRGHLGDQGVRQVGIRAIVDDIRHTVTILVKLIIGSVSNQIIILVLRIVMGNVLAVVTGISN